MANNTALPAVSGTPGDTIIDIDMTTSFSSYPTSGGKLPASCLYVSQSISGAPAPLTTSNPLPVGVQGSVTTTVTGLLLAQGSTTSGQTGPLIQAAVGGAAPAYTDATTAPLSQTIAGALRVDLSSTTANTTAIKVDGSAVTQPVSFSGAVNSAQSGNWNMRIVDSAGSNLAAVSAAGAVKVDASATTQPISAASLPLPTGAATDATVAALSVAQGSTTSGQTGHLVQGAVTTSAPTYVTAKTSPLSLTTAGGLRVDGSGVTQPVSLAAAVTVQQSTASSLKVDLSGTAANATAIKVDGSAVTQPVSAASLPLPTGAAADTSVNGILLAQASTTSGQKGPLVQGAVTTSNPTYTTAQTAPFSLTTAGSLRVDGSAVTQPVSATSLPLPTGAATAAKQPALGTAGSASADVLTIQGIASMTAVKVDGSAVTQPVSIAATVTTAGAKTNNNAAPGATNLGVLPGVANAAIQSWTEGNQVALSADLAGQLRATEPDMTASGTLAGAAQTVAIATSNDQIVSVGLTGTWNATLVFEATIDGSNWFTVNARVLGTAGFETQATVNKNYFIEAAGYSSVRVRCSAYTSGTATVSLRSTSGQRIWPVSPSFAAINLSAVTGDQTIVSAVSGQKVTVLGYGLWTSTTGAFTATWKSSGGTALSGPIPNSGTAGPFAGAADSPNGWLQSAAGEGLVLNLSTTATVTGYLKFTQG